jgi:Protein of unknown function (DUF1254)
VPVAWRWSIAVLQGLPKHERDYDLMLQEMLRKTSAKQKEIVYWPRPVDWKNQTLTPNPDALYFMIFFNTKDVGPLVIDVPPADGGSFAANIDTVWQMPLEDAGPYGADKGAGGKYLVVPPAYKEKAPDGYIAVQSETFAGYALFRSNLASHSDADIAKAAAYGTLAASRAASRTTKALTNGMASHAQRTKPSGRRTPKPRPQTSPSSTSWRGARARRAESLPSTIWSNADLLTLGSPAGNRFHEAQRRVRQTVLRLCPLHSGHFPTLPSPQFAGKTGFGDFPDALAEMDFHVGQILDAIDNLRIRDNTIVTALKIVMSLWRPPRTLAS